jgi:phosphatidylglycerol lysyltransferase
VLSPSSEALCINMANAPTSQSKEWSAAKEILDRYGRSSLDFFKLWPEKSYFFSQDKRCFVAYRKALRVLISLGDPVGPEEQLETATGEFVSFCSQRGWKAAFHQALPDFLPMYRKLQLQVAKFGEEAVVDLEHFRSVTQDNKAFRYIKHRLERDGLTVSRYDPPHDQRLLDEAKEVSDDWLRLSRRQEHGFALGWFDKGYLGEMSLYFLRDRAGSPVAFANEVPDYRKGETSLDMMRHKKRTPNSGMEYLVLTMLLDLAERGYEQMSLGLVPFSNVGNYAGASLGEKILHQIYEHGDRFFSFKGLHRFKAKFEPSWEDRFLVYQGGTFGLVRTILAEMRVTRVSRTRPSDYPSGSRTSG